MWTKYKKAMDSNKAILFLAKDFFWTVKIMCYYVLYVTSVSFYFKKFHATCKAYHICWLPLNFVVHEISEFDYQIHCQPLIRIKWLKGCVQQTIFVNYNFHSNDNKTCWRWKDQWMSYFERKDQRIQLVNTLVSITSVLVEFLINISL